MKKKNFTLILAFLMFISSYSFAQEEQTPKKSNFVFGSELGIITGSPIGPAEEGAKGKLGIGLHTGVFAKYFFNNAVAFQWGLAYNAKKASYETPVYDQDYTYHQDIALPDGSTVTAIIDTYFNGNVRGNFNNTYLESPILVYYYFNPRFSLHGGGYAALLLRGNHEVWATGVVGDNFDTVADEYSDESPFINKWDYGMSLGVNYKVYKQIECELRLSSGLRSIFSSEYQLADVTVRNVYMELKANYTFQF